jgi:hypothetical protein
MTPRPPPSPADDPEYDEAMDALTRQVADNVTKTLRVRRWVRVAACDRVVHASPARHRTGKG